MQDPESTHRGADNMLKGLLFLYLTTNSVLTERWRKAGLTVLAVVWMILAICYWFLRSDEPFLPLVWPFFFGITSAFTFLFAMFPNNNFLFKISGSLGVTAFASRPAGEFVRWSEGHVIGWRFFSSISIYSLLALLLGWFWLREVRPWSSRHESKMAGE